MSDINRRALALFAPHLQIVKKESPLLPDRPRALALFLCEAVEQILLCVKTNGATVIVTGRCLLMPIDDVQQLKRQRKPLRGPGAVFSNVIGIGRLINASENLFGLLLR